MYQSSLQFNMLNLVHFQRSTKLLILELNDVSDKTILFSDRPDRIITSVSTSNYIENWSIGDDSFAVDAPNAVLIVDEQEVEQDVTIVKLFTSIYDVQKKTLKYDVTPDNSTIVDLSNEFGELTLITDTRNDLAQQIAQLKTRLKSYPIF